MRANREPASGKRPTVFIHTNDAQMIAAQVAQHSLRTRSKSPDQFDIRLLRLEEMHHLTSRFGQRFTWWEGSRPSVFRRGDMMAFAPLRRLVPALMGFEGRALVLDPDIFAVGDVYELLTRDMQGKAILCRERPERRDGRPLYYSSVMLVDCTRLTHWQWEQDIEAIFAGRLNLGGWLQLEDESPDRIGLLEEEWNHIDTLTAETKLLHNSAIQTQPWKTGLRADYHAHAPRWPEPLETLHYAVRWLASAGRLRRIFYQPHPDPRQERLFFVLLKECLIEGSITRDCLKRAMRKNHLRKDALELLDQLA